MFMKTLQLPFNSRDWHLLHSSIMCHTASSTISSDEVKRKSTWLGIPAPLLQLRYLEAMVRHRSRQILKVLIGIQQFSHLVAWTNAWWTAASIDSDSSPTPIALQCTALKHALWGQGGKKVTGLAALGSDWPSTSWLAPSSCLLQSVLFWIEDWIGECNEVHCQPSEKKEWPEHSASFALLDACHPRAVFATQPVVYIALGLQCRRVSATRNPCTFDHANPAVRSRSEEGLWTLTDLFVLQNCLALLMRLCRFGVQFVFKTALKKTLSALWGHKALCKTRDTYLPSGALSSTTSHMLLTFDWTKPATLKVLHKHRRHDW